MSLEGLQAGVYSVDSSSKADQCVFSTADGGLYFIDFRRLI